MPLFRSRWLQAGLLLLVAFATRGWMFGNPLIHSDEQFYLLVGDRMWQGAWPFVDIFDRKPVGLFVIFAGIRAFGGDGIVAYQVAATLVAATTAFLVTRIAARYATAEPALAAGVLYLVWLVVLDGVGGQSSVWQNLFMAAAALPALDAIRTGRALTHAGAVAMLLVGCAMQVKYVALFDGLFLGLALLWGGWRTGRRPARIVADGALWVAAALLPTGIAWGVYAAAGYNDAFVFANFVSIFGQANPNGFGKILAKLAASLGLLVPLLWLAWAGRARSGLVAGWAAASLAGVVVMGTFDQHYFLPLALPLSAAAAAGLQHADGRAARRGFAVALAFATIAALLLVPMRIGQRGDAAAARRAVALIGQRPERCLFAFGSEPILYHLTRSCLPTPLVFRSHLEQSREAKGIPVDQMAETARVLATRPGVIVVREHRRNTNPATARLVDAAVAAHYRRVGMVRLGNLDHAVYRPRVGGR